MAVAAGGGGPLVEAAAMLLSDVGGTRCIGACGPVDAAAGLTKHRVGAATGVTCSRGGAVSASKRDVDSCNCWRSCTLVEVVG